MKYDSVMTDGTLTESSDEDVGDVKQKGWKMIRFAKSRTSGPPSHAAVGSEVH